MLDSRLLSKKAFRCIAARPLIWGAILLLVSPAASSQTQPQASLSGTLAVQQPAKPPSGVAVDLHDERGLRVAEAVTAADGSFLFAALPEGRYQLRVSLNGFQDYRETVTLSAGKRSIVVVVLQLKQLNEIVEVVALTTNEVATTSATAATLSGRTVDVEPVKGDDYKALLPLVPGVVRGPDGRINVKGAAATQSGLQWHQMSVTAPKGAALAQVYGSVQDNSQVWFDDFQFVEGGGP